MAQSKKTRTNIDLIHTASKIVDSMFPAGVAGKGPGAGSMPSGQTEGKKKKNLKGKAKSAKAAKVPGKSGKVGYRGAKKRSGSGGVTKTRGSARAGRGG